MTDNMLDIGAEFGSQLDTSRQVTVTGITWNMAKPREQFHSYRDTSPADLPESFTFDLPEDVYRRVKNAESQDVANDILETYAYNFLTKKFNHEVYSCSAWPQF